MTTSAASSSPADDAAATPASGAIAELERLVASPRLSGLAAARDGSLLAVTVATPSPDGKRYRSSIWGLDPTGAQQPRRLTRAAPGENGATFDASGDLLFTSARPDPDAEEAPDDPPGALWRLPREGGEAELLVAPRAGVGEVVVADDAEVAVFTARLHRGADTLTADEEQDRARHHAGVSAHLYDRGEYPIRFWDHWLGPREPALWVLDLTRPAEDAIRLLARGPALEGASFALSPDGTTVVTSWRRTGARQHPSDLASDLVAIDVASGQRRTLLADGRDHDSPDLSPDGRWVVCVASDLGAPDRAEEDTLVVVDLAEGTSEDLAPELDRWPSAPKWVPSGDAVVCATDDQGHRPLLRIEVADGRVTRLTGDGAYTDAVIAGDGTMHALRSTVEGPPRPVRVATDRDGQQPRPLPCPAGEDPDVARVERLVTTASDGVEIGSWLLTPSEATASSPVPLVVLVHGGPLSSWNGWHWRWNPHVLAAAGYAVLLPDPALSTGYGRAFIERGWGRWFDAPYTDVLATVEDAASRTDIDADRVAVAGGSFGGYLVNWIAGQTDRFRAIVTHASLWSLPGFHGTTDAGLLWEREFGDPYQDPSRYVENSPDRHVGRITTPMLVIHGEKDLRVPISEGLTLWTDLVRHDVDARFLYFPDEHHWVLKPQHARLWYQTVLAFLAEHLDGEPFERPALV
ncbi:MAG: S9 family peptidase [Nitriliruptoraceae bacterium]